MIYTVTKCDPAAVASYFLRSRTKSLWCYHTLIIQYSITVCVTTQFSNMKASSILPQFFTAIGMFGAVTSCLPHASAEKGCSQMKAMIYRGKSSCDGCPESIQNLLETAYPNINVVFAGPKEKTRINAETLSQVDIFVQPGGPGMYLTMHLINKLFLFLY
jgi:hypothetical protein